MQDDILYALAAKVGEALKARGLMLATAESCTGGWIGEAITAVAGSSDWFDRGFITYSNRAKQEMLSVKAETLTLHGAVSEATVAEMALGAARASGASVTVAVSGIAGPSGAVPGKPVGTVCFGWCIPNAASPIAETKYLSGDREAVRRQAVVLALQGILNRL